jgi:hypothetical protein
MGKKFKRVEGEIKMTQLILDLENEELTDSLKAFSINQKKSVEEVAIEAIKYFIASSGKKDKPVYVKKDVSKNMRLVKKKFDESLCNEVALIHIKESASYVHNLRRQSAG